MNDRGDDDRSRREAEAEAEARLLRGRHASHLVDVVGIDNVTADRVMTALFEHVNADGRRCECGCHPRLSTSHDDGFDCPCMWDRARRAKERQRLAASWNTSEATALRADLTAEEREIDAWVAGQPGVEAKQISWAAPEQWMGVVDGHSFYFRERGGSWQLKLDLAPTGRYAERVVERKEDGEFVTEPVPVEEGVVIGEGTESQLGDGAIEHITFIVRMIRDHLWARQCDHAGALFFCPKCGQRMNEPI